MSLKFTTKIKKSEIDTLFCKEGYLSKRGGQPNEYSSYESIHKSIYSW